MKGTITRIHKGKYSRTMYITIPSVVVTDESFPLHDCKWVIIRIEGDKLIVERAEVEPWGGKE